MDDELMADDEVDVDFGEQQEGTERAPMTAEELRAHKRKMKRFRHVVRTRSHSPYTNTLPDSLTVKHVIW